MVKYWGKRNQELNLPITDSLSLSLPVGTKTTVRFNSRSDRLVFNGKELKFNDAAFVRVKNFLDLFRLDLFRNDSQIYFDVITDNEVPTAAGLASSASGFAALVQALDSLFGWKLQKSQLSILARLGSGSASRSLYPGFVQWHRGLSNDGFDSFAEPLNILWPDLCFGLWIISSAKKPIDSRDAMNTTVQTSKLYDAWPSIVEKDMQALKQALYCQDFTLFGSIAESNAMAMHATMHASTPSIMYWLPESILAMQQIWQFRKEGLKLYFTMDAGPNLKVLFLESDRAQIQKALPKLQIMKLSQ